MVTGDSGEVDVFCTLMGHLQNRFSSGDERLTLSHLDELLTCSKMKSLLMIFNDVKALALEDCEFQCCNTILLVNEVLSCTVCDHHSKDENACEMCELSELFFSSPHLVALLRCQNQIIKKEFEPELPNLVVSEWISQDEDESMKVVRLMKGNEPLGATIAVDEETGNIVIARILKGGAADRSGLIHANDVLVSINKVPTKDRKPDEIIHQLTDYTGPLTFCLIPAESSLLHRNKEDDVLHVRAKFDYDPRDDNLIPCVEAGLPFRKNDILRIVSREDSLWWQAAAERSGMQIITNSSPAVTRAGLIPSERLQKKRQSMSIKRTNSLALAGGMPTKGSSSSLTIRSGKSTWTLLRQSFRRPKKKEPTGSHGSSLFSQQNTPIYEEVTCLPPPALQSLDRVRFRPLVLIGPQGIGRNVLKDRLIDTDPCHYGVPVPHTSRERVPGDEDGKDYHFVTRGFMESGIQKGMFLEYGEYKGNIYGTSLGAVEDVIASHQVCILTPYPRALKLLCKAELKPCVIFIKPPPVIGSGSQTADSQRKLTIDRKMATPLTPEESQDLLERGNRIETLFGHFFDYTIVSRDIDAAFSELLQVASSVENQQQWIPSSW